MNTVKEIQTALFELAPEYMKESWDNVGLLCGRDRPVETVLVALDPFPCVAREARDRGAQLLVTHHPVIFGNIRAVNQDSLTGRTLLFLIENGISALNLHTNLDEANGGVNDALAEALGLHNVAVLAPAGEDGGGHPYGLGRYGEVQPCTLPAFLNMVKERLSCGGLRFAGGGKEVRRVAVGGGACGELLIEALARGCDTYVTADVKYNQFADAAELGLNLIDAGHFSTENVIVPVIARFLHQRFPALTILESETNRDCIRFA